MTVRFRTNPTRNAVFDRLAEDFGIVIPEALDFVRPEWRRNLGVAQDAMRREFGLDAAQPLSVTVGNAGIPAFLANFIDPKFIEVFTAPLKAATILREVKKGDWVTMTTQFPVIESTGQVSTYGDYSNSGEASIQTNWESRQSYYFQTQTEWGERELALGGLAKIDVASRKNIASAKVMNEFQNQTYFYGVQGLMNYGLLNDPSLPAAVAPLSSGGNYTWASKDALAVYADIAYLVQLLIKATDGVITMASKMVLAMSPASEVNLTKTTQYNVSVADMLKKNFPGLRIETAVQYETASGNLVQLIADELGGQDVAFCAFNEKMRAHAIVRDTSSFKQKKSGGSWGTILEQPLGVQQMLGV